MGDVSERTALTESTEGATYKPSRAGFNSGNAPKNFGFNHKQFYWREGNLFSPTLSNTKNSQSIYDLCFDG